MPLKFWKNYWKCKEGIADNTISDIFFLKKVFMSGRKIIARTVPSDPEVDLMNLIEK